MYYYVGAINSHTQPATASGLQVVTCFALGCRETSPHMRDKFRSEWRIKNRFHKKTKKTNFYLSLPSSFSLCSTNCLTTLAHGGLSEAIWDSKELYHPTTWKWLPVLLCRFHRHHQDTLRRRPPILGILPSKWACRSSKCRSRCSRPL